MSKPKQSQVSGSQSLWNRDGSSCTSGYVMLSSIEIPELTPEEIRELFTLSAEQQKSICEKIAGELTPEEIRELFTLSAEQQKSICEKIAGELKPDIGM
jgi:uncharacterized protein YoaH (UPF0181 family)